MDFRMDKASWGMIIFILATVMYFMIEGAGGTVNTAGYIQAFGFSVLVTIVMIALASIPVVIICLFIKRIPDIDYSIWAATAFTIVGIISEII